MVEKSMITILLFCFLRPIVIYSYDSKRLRRFPNQNILSGITNLVSLRERRRNYELEIFIFGIKKSQSLGSDRTCRRFEIRRQSKESTALDLLFKNIEYTS